MNDDCASLPQTLRCGYCKAMEQSKGVNKMSQLHCLDCGSKLETVNYHVSCTKYSCDKCNKYWFQSRRIVVEWAKKAKA